METISLVISGESERFLGRLLTITIEPVIIQHIKLKVITMNTNMIANLNDPSI